MQLTDAVSDVPRHLHIARCEACPSLMSKAMKPAWMGTVLASEDVGYPDP